MIKNPKVALLLRSLLSLKVPLYLHTVNLHVRYSHKDRVGQDWGLT